LALLVSADGGADTVLVADRSESALPPHLDLTGGRYVNDLDGLSARLSVRDLTPRTSSVGFTLNFADPERTFRVTATRTKLGRQTYLVQRVTDAGRIRRTCSEFVATWDDTRDRIDVHVPWSCLGDLRATMKVHGYLAAGRMGSADSADTARTADSLRNVRVRYR
jgi:hypothetical protein